MSGNINGHTLHVVALNIPYPANYGGVIDIYYKLKALHQIGVNIILHCYEYNRQPANELNEICKKVYYYKRHNSIINQFSTIPFIVKSRQSKQLLKNLLADDYPVLLEGLHCTTHLKMLHNAGKYVAVRTHNIEHHYYFQLAKATKNLGKKLYYLAEGFKLRTFEKVLSFATDIFAISISDKAYFEYKYGRAQLIPAFHSMDALENKTGKGDFLLLHGNLSVPENEKSINYLISKILKNKSLPIVIAGSNPSKKLISQFKNHQHIQLVINPSDEKMKQLHQDAQIILLHSHQSTGVKLKLISSLYLGRHIICNKHVLQNSGLETLCHEANTINDWHKTIDALWNLSFDLQEIERRNALIDKLYNNNKNAITLSSYIFG